jgi:hypothetical protein
MQKFWQNRPQKFSVSLGLLFRVARKQKEDTKKQIMGLTSRREKIVLFGDSLTQRAIEQGGWGESLVRRREFIFISFFFSFIITQSYVFSFFACLCWCFLFLNLIAARLEFCREEEV